MMVMEVRPYWENSFITPMATELDFGNPSGHMTTSSTMALIIVLDLCNIFKKPILTCLLLIGWFGYEVLMAYSRMMLGVHSLNQVTFGFLYGSWMGLVAQFII